MVPSGRGGAAESPLGAPPQGGAVGPEDVETQVLSLIGRLQALCKWVKSNKYSPSDMIYFLQIVPHCQVVYLIR